MFKTLLYSIFPSFKSPEVQPNFEYFEHTKNDGSIVEQSNANYTVNKTIVNNANEVSSALFLSFLFGESTDKVVEDQLSCFVSNKIEFLLKKQSSKLIDALPVMPATIALLINELKSEEFNTDILISSINSEPSIATEVIKLANSAKYKRGEKEVTDLKAAFMSMGKQGLLEGVIYHYINDFKPVASVYYRQFGEKIWQHCHQTAEYTQALTIRLGHPELSATAYFLGLIVNLGHMIIFQLMTDAFSCIDPNSSPNSEGFKRLINLYSIKLTYTIAKTWQLPEVILQAIAIQAQTENCHQLTKYKERQPLAIACYEANKLSELVSLKNVNLIDSDALDEALSKNPLVEEMTSLIE
ncbi:HDOD domain-containing protein [Thalassotalea sp. M1531]|uniref:HDOD domain-containing protein n=1 Tax=Thalassotalea algicola TaxID=2716224 RepID=A0A7Y0Q7W3_9GAMM|nr:HDOD domain-containing protein [Thalassotalea algicola]NMP32327.1 HDOD domain-containing protein [Thalassotalea algicola]